MNRTKGVLAAGSLTGLIVMTMLALGFQNINAQTNGMGTVEPTPIIIQQPETGAATNEAIQAWQTYSSDLENTVQTMQQREAAYQAQIEAANQTILQMQNQVNEANAARVQISVPAQTFRENESYEHEAHENESHEHEAHESEEHDD